MTLILFVGRALPPHDLLDDLTRRGYVAAVAQRLPADRGGGQRGSQLVIVSLEGDSGGIRAAQREHRPGVPWLAWNRTSDQTQALLAYAAGATAVLPPEITGQTLALTIATILGLAPDTPPQPGRPVSQRRYRRGAAIALEPGDVLEVARGIVAQTMVHADGAEVLLGLYGPDQMIIGHPADGCGVSVHAHTDVVVMMRAWHTAASDPHTAERLRARVQLMEAWSAMQARPHLGARILGLLNLLAEQFGRRHADGMLVDVRLTHAQIAAAIGATRSTVTRLLSDLRDRGAISVTGAGDRERFCLREWELGQHTRASGRPVELAPSQRVRGGG